MKTGRHDGDPLCIIKYECHKNKQLTCNKMTYLSNNFMWLKSIKIFLLITDLPIWNYDGSSTYQSQGDNSDTFLYPVAIFNDPFRLAPNKLVMCEAYKHDHTPTGNIL